MGASICPTVIPPVRVPAWRRSVVRDFREMVPPDEKRCRNPPGNFLVKLCRQCATDNRKLLWKHCNPRGLFVRDASPAGNCFDCAWRNARFSPLARTVIARFQRPMSVGFLQELGQLPLSVAFQRRSPQPCGSTGTLHGPGTRIMLPSDRSVAGAEQLRLCQAKEAVDLATPDIHFA